MHSVRLEPTKLILIGTRTTYQATGDGGVCHCGEKMLGIKVTIKVRLAVGFRAYTSAVLQFFHRFPEIPV